MSQIKLTKTEKQVTVQAPALPTFSAKAKKMGKWDSTSKVWVFDARLEKEVIDLVKSSYGTLGNDGEPLVDVELKALADIWGSDAFGYSYALCLFGRVIATAQSRDSGAKVGDGVAIVEGAIKSGGSAKYPDARIKEGSTIKIFDVPRSLVEGETSKLGEKAEVTIMQKEDEMSTEEFLEIAEKYYEKTAFKYATAYSTRFIIAKAKANQLTSDEMKNLASGYKLALSIN